MVKRCNIEHRRVALCSCYEKTISVLCDRAKFQITNNKITLQVCCTRIRTNLGQVEASGKSNFIKHVPEILL